jgi:hypothetical protein
MTEPDEEALRRLKLLAALSANPSSIDFDVDRWVSAFPDGMLRWGRYTDEKHAFTELHRESGPAVERPGEIPMWYRNGALCNPDGTVLLSKDQLVISFGSVAVLDHEAGIITMHSGALDTIVVEDKT